MNKFNKLNDLIAYMSKAVSGNQTNSNIHKTFKEFAIEIRNTISQFDFLLKSILNPSDCITDDSTNSLQRDGELLIAKIMPLKNDIEVIWSHVKQLSPSIGINDDLSNIKSHFFSQELETFFIKVKNQNLKNIKADFNEIIKDITNFEFNKIFIKIGQSIEKLENYSKEMMKIKC